MTMQHDSLRNCMIYDGPHEAVGDILQKLERYVPFDELCPAVARMLAVWAASRGIGPEDERAFYVAIGHCMHQGFRARPALNARNVDTLFGWAPPPPLVPPAGVREPQWRPKLEPEVAEALPQRRRPSAKPPFGLSEQEVATMAWRWAGGEAQRLIAKDYRLFGASSVSQAIGWFLLKYVPDDESWKGVGGATRRHLVRRALAAYAKAGGAKVRLKAKAALEGEA